MNEKQKLIKNILFSAFVVLVLVYIIFDVSIKTSNHLQYKGHKNALVNTIIEAKNENCDYFTIYVEGEEVGLINIECLQEYETEKGFIIEDEQNNL